MLQDLDLFEELARNELFTLQRGRRRENRDALLVKSVRKGVRAEQALQLLED